MIAWRVMRAGVYIALAGVVVFFALTRTEVGRDGIRQQLESRFNERFAGSLEIGSLQGTLLNELRATDVRLRTAKGRIVASIDSVATTPQWRHLLAARLSVGSLTLIRPHLSLRRDAKGTWNLQKALKRTAPSATNLLVDINATDVRIQNGKVTTRRTGPDPPLVKQGWLFDYSRSVADQLTLEANLGWTENSPEVDISSLNFRLPKQKLTVHSARTKITRIRDRWSLESFSAEIGNTHLEAQGTLQPSPRDPTKPTVDIKIGESQLDYDEIHRLVPRVPLRGVVTVEGRVGGSIDRFVVNEFTMTHGRSTATVQGTAFGLPDSLDVEAQFSRTQLHPGDVRTVWPDAPVDTLSELGVVELGGTLRGTVEWRNRSRPTFDVTATVDGQGQAGAVRGSLDVRRFERKPLQYSSRLSVDSLNLARVTGDARLDSRLSGKLDLRGTGREIGSIEGRIDASLSSSRIGSRTLAAADINIDVEKKTLTGNVRWKQPSGGQWILQGRVDRTEGIPTYEIATTLTDFNLANSSTTLPSTRLNGSLSVTGQGETWTSLQGTATVAVDSSTISRGDSTVRLPPHEMRLALNESSPETPRLTLKGTIGTIEIDGPLLHPVLRTSGQQWTNTLRSAVAREVTEAKRPSRRLGSDRGAVRTDTTASVPQFAEESDPSSAQSDPVRLSSTIAIQRMDLVRRWWPTAPVAPGGLHSTSTLTISPDTLTLSGNVETAHLRAGRRTVDSLNASYHVSGPFRNNPIDALTATISADADTFRFGDRSVVGPSATLTLADREGALHARADGVGRTGPFRITSDVNIKDGARFRVTNLYVGAGQHAWLLDSPGIVSLYSDAVVVDSLALESSRPLSESTQQIQIRGTVSAASTDTLHANLTDVLLYPASQLASTKRPIGGRLNGQIAVTGGLEQPQVRSSFSVHRFTFDRRVLGTLRVQTRLTQNSPDLLVNAALDSNVSSLDSLDGPPMVPKGPRSIEGNHLDISGRIRLPGWAEITAPSAPMTSEQLDLSVDIDRADLFFFEYIFDENLARVRGYTAGTLHIGGHFRHPVFDAVLQIEDARFDLPQFGLSYTATGPVTIDRRGIHTEALDVQDEGGSATLSGSVLFNEYRYLSFDLSADLRELQIIDVTTPEDLPFYGQISASGPATLTGPLQNATLRSEGARTTPESELFIPVSEGDVNDDSGFIVFADSTGQIPNLRELTRRDNILSDRPAGEPSFLEGLEIDINVLAPEESTVHLVFDPIVGDVVTAEGSGRIQLQRQEGEFFVYGSFNVSGGTYLFTAGEVFVRRFNINGGTITWDGPPTNAQLDLEAEYRTRASRAGLPGYTEGESRIPIRVLLDIGGRVETPQVELSLARVRDQRNNLVGSKTLDAILNQADRTTEYATSVLLTNTFLLTTESFTEGNATGADGSTSGSLTRTGPQLAFNSVSQLVASQLNRYLGAALPNVDLNLGLQGENPNDLDLIYGVALRLLNERLVIRGEGVYTGEDPSNRQATGPQGEFVVEVRLSNRVSVEAFYRRSGDELTRGETLTSSRGAGLSYQTEFSSWTQLFGRIFGWLWPTSDRDDDTETDPDPVARRKNESADASNTAADPSNSKQ